MSLKRIFIETLCVLFFLSAPDAATQSSRWRTSNLQVFDHCFDFDRFPDLRHTDPALLATLCYFLQINQRHYTHRFREGNALAFSLNDYTSMGHPQGLITFLVDVRALRAFLLENGLWDKVELGLYPQAELPYIYLSLGGGPGSRWVEVDGERLPFVRAVEWIWQELRGLEKP